ncbi:hypothetical protein SEUCBS139899_005743 [Sporothrix eucalyptigena]
MMFFRRSGTAFSGRRGPESFSTIARFAFIAGFVTLAATGFLLSQYSPEHIRNVAAKIPHLNLTPDTEAQQAATEYDHIVRNVSDSELHPIDRLIASSRKAHEELVAKRSYDVATAAAKYRERRGRHPPPGFEKWMEYAIGHDAIVVEEFFDRIYHDLNPFWGLEPNTLAGRARNWHHVVRVRDGKASGVGDVTGRVPWLKLWTDLVSEAAPNLPDVDMPINYMDESRLLVKWEEIEDLVKKAEEKRAISEPHLTVQKYRGLSYLEPAMNASEPPAYDPPWITTNSPQYWDLSRAACAPNSPARNIAAIKDFSKSPSLPSDWHPPFSSEGYVKNYTASADPCTQPHLRSLHGTFIEPLSISTSTELIPLFGGCKLPTNNEILIPGAMYLTDDPFYSGGNGHGPQWAQKKGGIIWRGVASGGRNKKENWSHFQRHRLLEMLNGTTVSALEKDGARANTFDMAPLSMYDYKRRRNGSVGAFLSEFADAGFTDLLCFPAGECEYIDPHFHALPSKPMAEQYVNKFIPDADGNSFSARFRGLLLSTSLPLKATIYAEWHDDRLAPWLHFAPLDNTFQDLHAVLDYFTSSAKGDAAARLLASTGKRWGEQVLRRDDMLLYVWRLLLEFARVCDENRLKLGYIDDLIIPEGSPQSP